MKFDSVINIVENNLKHSKVVEVDILVSDSVKFHQEMTKRGYIVSPLSTNSATHSSFIIKKN